MKIEKELTKMGNAKLTEQQVSEILSARLYESPTPSYSKLSRRFNVGAETIARICTRVSWQSVPVPERPVCLTGSSHAQEV